MNHISQKKEGALINVPWLTDWYSRYSPYKSLVQIKNIGWKSQKNIYGSFSNPNLQNIKKFLH